jgi:hypothetical protein
MSKEHAKVAKQIPGSVIRCGPRRMLHYICEKCGSGQPFKAKNGKTLTMPAGRFQCTDKEMMKVLGVDSRRQTMIDWRRAMKKATRGAVTTKNEFKQGYTHPTIVYYVDLEKLEALATQTEIVCDPHTKNVCEAHTEIVLDGHTENVYPHTKTAAHTGVLTEQGSPSAPKSGAKHGRPKKRGAAAAANAAQRVATAGAQASPHFISVTGCMRDLVPVGYEANPEQDTIQRIATCIEADQDTNPDLNYSVSEVFEYVSKAKWILDLTQGRTDWLADRFESDDKRCLLNQFHSFIGSRRRHEVEAVPSPCVYSGCKVPLLPDQVESHNGMFHAATGGYLEGEIDMDEEPEVKSAETEEDVTARTSPFTLYNGVEVLPICTAYWNRNPVLKKYSASQLWAYHNGQKWIMAANRKGLESSLAAAKPLAAFQQEVV